MFTSVRCGPRRIRVPREVPGGPAALDDVRAELLREEEADHGGGLQRPEDDPGHCAHHDAALPVRAVYGRAFSRFL